MQETRWVAKTPIVVRAMHKLEKQHKQIHKSARLADVVLRCH